MFLLRHHPAFYHQGLFDSTPSSTSTAVLLAGAGRPNGWTATSSNNIHQHHQNDKHQASTSVSSTAAATTTTKHNENHEKKHHHHHHHHHRMIYRSVDAHASEKDDQFILTMDLPGVKSEQVTVQVTGGGTGLTIAADRHQQQHHDPTLGNDDEDDTTTYGPVVVAYRQQFAIDDDLVNAEQLQATLVDGVLTIMLPKKEAAQPIPVPVIEGEAVVDDTDGTAGDLYTITFDIPGVKADELQVVVHHGMLTITVVRAQKRGGHNHDSFTHRVQRRTMMLDRHRTDVTASKAYLSHGVLTFTAPHKTPVAAKTVPLNATTTLLAAAVEQKPTKVLVETVSEEDAGAAVAMNMM